MATPVSAPLLKSQPDVGKINTFTGCIVTVTRHMQPRGTIGTTVVATQTMTKDSLLALPAKLQETGAAGYYMFSATDAGGTGSDEWMTKIGPDIPEVQQMAGPNGIPPTINGAGGAPIQLGDGVRQIGPGWFYDSATGIIVTPWRTAEAWQPGQPLPQPPPQHQNATPAPHLQVVPQNASPLNWPQGGGWGNYPVNDGESQKIKVLEAKIADDRRERELSEMKADQRRQQDETNKRIDEQARLTREMFEKLTQALTAKPTGPDENIMRMERALEAQKLENKEILARAEAREREDRLRAEIKLSNDAMQAAVREMSANKTDPMMPLLMNMMTSQQAQAAEAVKAIQLSTSTATAASERNIQTVVEQLRATIMSPMQLIAMLQQAQSTGSDGQKMIVESLRESMNMQREVFGQLLEVSSQGGQPAWVGLLDNTLNKIGSIGQALASRPAAQAAQPQRQAPPPQQMRTPVAQAPQPQVQQQPQQAQVAAQAPPQAQAAAPKPAAGPKKSEKIKKGRRKKGTEGDIVPGVTRKEGYTIEEMKEASPSDIREVTKGIADEQFFMEIYPYINMLRGQIDTGLNPEGAAEMILRNRGEIQAAGIFPPAVQLLFSEQIEVLVERILPKSPNEYRAKVVEIIEAQLVAEASGEDEGDEEDDVSEGKAE